MPDPSAAHPAARRAAAAAFGPEGARLYAVGQGDRAAFDALVSAEADGLWRTLRLLCPSEALAEDALQETLLAVWSGAAAWSAEAPPRAWITGIARRQAARTWRLRAGQPAAPLALDDEPAEALATLGAAAGWGQDLDGAAWQRALEDHELLHAALGALSPDDRALLVLRDLEQRSGAEVAAALDLPLAAMKSRLHRARLRLMAVVLAEVNRG